MRLVVVPSAALALLSACGAQRPAQREDLLTRSAASAIAEQEKLASVLDRLAVGPCRRDPNSHDCIEEMHAGRELAEQVVREWERLRGPARRLSATVWARAAQLATQRFLSAKARTRRAASRAASEMRLLAEQGHTLTRDVYARARGAGLGRLTAQRIQDAVDRAERADSGR